MPPVVSTVAAEIAGQRGAPRGQLGGGHRLGAEPAHLGEDQAEHLGGGVVAGLRAGHERAPGARARRGRCPAP